MDTRSYRNALTGLAAVSLFATAPFRSQAMSQLSGRPMPGPVLLTVSTVIEIALSYAIIQTGLDLGQRIDLAWPPIDGWDERRSSTTRLRRAVVTAVLMATALAVLITLPGTLFSARWHIRDLASPPLAARVLAALGAGVSEEIWFRLGAMTVFAWLLTKLPVLAQRRRVAFWTATVLAAALFWAAHFPQVKARATLTPSLVAFVVLAQGGLGLICGWLYWRRGLLSAMIAHATYDLIVSVGFPLVHIG